LYQIGQRSYIFYTFNRLKNATKRGKPVAISSIRPAGPQIILSLGTVCLHAASRALLIDKIKGKAY